MAAVHSLSNRLLLLIAIALQLPTDFFLQFYDKPMMYLRPLHYSPQVSLPDEVTTLPCTHTPHAQPTTCRLVLCHFVTLVLLPMYFLTEEAVYVFVRSVMTAIYSNLQQKPASCNLACQCVRKHGPWCSGMLSAHTCCSFPFFVFPLLCSHCCPLARQQCGLPLHRVVHCITSSLHIPTGAR